MIKELWKMFPEALLAGGAVRSLYDNTPTEDYDFFIPSFSVMEELWHSFDNGHFLVDKVLFKCPQKRLVSLRLKGGEKVQLIYIEDYSSPQRLVEFFDFNVCCGTKDIDGRIFHTPEFYEGTRDKILKINNISYPMATMRRVVKYAKKGYSVDSEVYKELAKAIVVANEKEKLDEKEDGWSWYNSDSVWSFSGVD